MHNVEPPPEPSAGHPVVDLAFQELRAFGGENLSRDQAARLLPHWRHFHQLTEHEVMAVLDRFPTVDHGWLSGTMGSTP